MTQHATPSTRLHPVILSGGSGARLWPVSRSGHPKQLQSLVGDRSLFQATVLRCRDSRIFAPPIILCNAAHHAAVVRQLEETGVSPARLVIEPVGRNTAPAVTVAALCLADRAPDDLMLVLPSDHVIGRPQALLDGIAVGEAAARSGRLVTFGIEPDRIETGFGHILPGTGIEGSPGCSDVLRFLEKPDRATAEGLVASGAWLWNSGMFLFRAGAWLEAVDRFAPAVSRWCREAMRSPLPAGSAIEPDGDPFGRSPAISVDSAVLEKTDQAAVVPIDPGWRDAGSWSALWQAGCRDPDGNVTAGDVILHEVRNSLVHADSRLVAVAGAQGLAIVETADAVLVTSLEQAQSVRTIVGELLRTRRPEAATHRLTRHRWGTRLLLDQGPGYRVARLVVDPGAGLACRPDGRCSLTWHVLSGTGQFSPNPEGHQTTRLARGATVQAAAGISAGLRNPSPDPLVLIETELDE